MEFNLAITRNYLYLQLGGPSKKLYWMKKADLRRLYAPIYRIFWNDKIIELGNQQIMVVPVRDGEGVGEGIWHGYERDLMKIELLCILTVVVDAGTYVW